MPADSVLEIPVKVVNMEIVGYAIKITAKVGDQVMAFDHVVTFKELEDREKVEREVSKVIGQDIDWRCVCG